MDLSAIWRGVGTLLDALGASWAAILKTPPAIVGGIVGGLLTGGLFGWISHVRSIRPILIFFRDENETAPKWKVKNIGQGPAMHIRIRDYDAKGDVVRKVRPYPLMPGKDRPLDWVTGGAKLETDYTDAYGRNWYRSIGIENETIFTNRRSWWLRPSLEEIKEYDVEIHVLRAMRK